MTRTLNREEYIRLLAKTLPRVIDTEAEYERLLAEAEKLMQLGEEIGEEQAEILELLVLLIERYEDEHYQLKSANTPDILLELMQARGINPEALGKMLGSEADALEVLDGTKKINSIQAQSLAEFFHVSPSLFL